MSKYDAVKKGDKIVLHNSSEDVIVVGIAREDWVFKAGDLAHFNAWVERTTVFPGVEAVMVNTNIWNVYRHDDPDLIEVMREVPLDYGRYETIYGPVFYPDVRVTTILDSNN